MNKFKNVNCREIFKNAYEKRYTWKNDFKGYRGKCSFLIENKKYDGKFILGKDFKPEIEEIADEQVKRSISSQLFEVAIHRVKREFEKVHSENDFQLENISENGFQMRVSGKNEGDKYRVKNDCINMVRRKIHGINIEIFVEQFLDTGIGFLSKKYTSQQINANNLKYDSKKFEYIDQFINIGDKNTWILNSRTIKCLNKCGKKEIQKFVFEDLTLAE